MAKPGDEGGDVLVTGSSGQIGGSVAEALERAGRRVRRFDLERGDDLRDAAAVDIAVRGCASVVHSGAIPHDSRGTPADIVATNVLGTWHVLEAAERHGASRVVYLSSAQVFGCAEGEGRPDYLPVDDRHPHRAARPYGMSKRLAETMCEAFAGRSGVTTIALRPVLVLSEARLRDFRQSDAEYDAFVHLDDVRDAVLAALDADLPLFSAALLCGPGAFDASRARRLLQWTASRGWLDDEAEGQPPSGAA